MGLLFVSVYTCLRMSADVWCIYVMFFYIQRVLPKLICKKDKHFTKLLEILKLKENDYICKVDFKKTRFVNKEY